MRALITAIYDRWTNNGFRHIISHGVFFHLAIGQNQLMFDLGLLDHFLMKNIQKLEINPNEILKIVFSHAHADHTWGLNAFLKNRSKRTKLPIFAHPFLFEEKRAHIKKIILWNAGFRKLRAEQESKVKFCLDRNPVQLLTNLSTTRKISLKERIKEQNLSHTFVRKVDGKWISDPVLDDLSLILKTSEGLALICGDCHSGLFNIIEKAENLLNDEVYAIFGRVHLIFSKKEKIFKIVERLKEKKSIEILYLNHSIGRRTFSILKKKLVEKKVCYFPVGKK